MLRNMSEDDENRTKLLTVKLTPEEHADFKIAAREEHSGMSNLVRMFVARKSAEWKVKMPQAFNKSPVAIRAVIRKQAKGRKDSKG